MGGSPGAALLLGLAAPMMADSFLTRGECGENLTWIIDDDMVILTISGTGEMYDWQRADGWSWGWLDYSIQTVDIKTGVTSIGNWAFNECENLTSINIPNSVTRIGDYALGFCRSLQTINVSDDNPNYKVVEGILFNSDATTLLRYPAGTNATGYTIPDTVTSIGSGAFYGCGNLENISVSNENQNFTVLDGVLFNRDATTLLCYPAGKTAAEYTIPNGVTRIGNGAFYSCANLVSVSTPNSVTIIEDVAFSECSSLTSVPIPDSVISIGDYAFAGCESLTNVTIPNNVTSIGDAAFANCWSLTSVTIPNSVTSIGDWAFSGCISLTSVSIPNGVTSIGDSAFYLCWNLTDITIPDRVMSIGDEAFAFCSRLKSIMIPDGVTNIGDSAFSYCDSLTDVYYNGTENQWNAMHIGSDNAPLLNATIHFNGGSDPAPVHTHTLTHHAARPADCTQDGNVEYWFCADCGTYFADEEARRELSADELVLPALGHDWGEWVRVKEPTETAYGRKTRTCARCGATESVLIQMLPSVTPETPTQPPQTEPEPHAFADVPETEWYVEAVNYAWDKGLMQGVSETEFAPDATADRAMLVTILHRMAEEPEAAAAAFADVDADAWFAKAVAWASETGVVSGYEDGLFHPNQPITREQLVTMLWRMAGKPEAEPVETGTAEWAAEAMSWAIGRGVILGDGSGYSPRRTATRAEVAAILMRCDQL